MGKIRDLFADFKGTMSILWTDLKEDIHVKDKFVSMLITIAFAIGAFGILWGIYSQLGICLMPLMCG